MSIRSRAKGMLAGWQDRRYRRALADKKVSYGEWIEEKEQGRGEICGSGETPRLVYLIASEGKLSEKAGLICGQYFAEHQQCQIAYGDEDVWEAEGGRTKPWFKPDWSPDLLDSFFYFGSVVVMREELWQRVTAVYKRPKLREDTQDGVPFYRIEKGEAAQDTFERFLHGCVSLAGGYVREKMSIGHISEILFHCTSEEEQKKFLEPSRLAGQRTESLYRDFRDGFVGVSSEHTPVVSVIVPSKDQPGMLENCLKACKRAGTEGMPCEIVIVDNGSDAENRRQIERLVKEQEDVWWSIRYLYEPMEFHFSRMCNRGAARAKGLFLLFLNDDVELCQPESILKLAALADREFTGAVGMKLYYPDTCRIQHAGITNLPMGPVHKLQFLEDGKPYYYNANRGRHNVLAVTAACMMVEKEKFDRAGGFAEELRVAFNDVDLGFTLYEQGYYNVCANDLFAYHHESFSRGDDESAQKLGRLLAERAVLYRRHPGLEGWDPYYSEGLGREGLDTGIRPAYETAGNRIQRSDRRLSLRNLGDFRQDACLLIRVEEIREEKLLGYGVVLGDDNACYRYELLLSEEKERDAAHQKEDDTAYGIALEGQYRPDLEENMPDQVNVGLCGFYLQITAAQVPYGRYRIGIAAYNRVTGLKLMNFSSRSLVVE